MINVNPVKNESYFQENGENKIEKKNAQVIKVHAI